MKKVFTISLICLMLFITACDSKNTEKGKAETGSIPSNVIKIDIDSISKGEVVLVGSLTVEKGHSLNYDLSSDSGKYLFIALHEDNNIISGDNVLWKYFNGSALSLKEQTLINENGTYYVYVGSDDENIKNVKGTVSYN